MFYIIKHKTRDVYVGVDVESNEDYGYRNSTTIWFATSADTPYLFKDKSVVDNILNGTHQYSWYNSSIDSPTLPEYVKKEIIKNYEVVKLVVDCN